MVNEDNDSRERGRSMTRRIVTTNITFNRLCNYFPNMTPAHAIRELLKMALESGKLNQIHNAHRDSTYIDRGYNC